MRQLVKVMLLTALCTGLAAAQSVRLSTAYNYPTLPGTAQDSVLNGLKSIRGMAFDVDVDGDGKSEIALTNYNDQGHVHIFEAVGNDSIQLVWTSPTVATGGGGSTPRYVVFGDLDNDGRKEVIFQSNNNGIYVFEWDGVMGSDNYGTSPSQLIGASFLAGVSGNAEYMEVLDVDGDGSNELLVAYNSSPNDNDRYYIISGVGGWSTNDPGFSSFTVEYEGVRTQIPPLYGISGGSPYAMIAANLDGTGNKEILIHNWNLKNVSPMRVPSANTYQLADTANGKQSIKLSDPNDYVALFGAFAFDVDKDGREEVYLPTYIGSDTSGTTAGGFHMIFYGSGQSTAEIDTSNVRFLDLTPVMGKRLSTFGYGYGDIDGDLKYEVYTSTSYPFNVISSEFQGGDKKNPANWTSSVLYAGDPTIFTALTIKDSSGTIDTTSRSIDGSFASKIWARETDFDKDGFEDILLPYQALADSMTVTTLTWNGSSYDTVVAKQVNPKRWGFRIIEGTIVSGIEAKDLTIITPDDFRLEQNYPNPFNPSTTIPFSLPVRAQVSLKIYDMLGKEVRTLINNEQYPAGQTEISWDGKANNGAPVSSGTYFYSLIYGNFQKTNKMILVK